MKVREETGCENEIIYNIKIRMSKVELYVNVKIVNTD